MRVALTTTKDGKTVGTEVRRVYSDKPFHQLQVWFGRCSGSLSYDNGVKTKQVGWTFERGGVITWVECLPDDKPEELTLSLLEVFDGAAHVDDFVIWSSFSGGLAQITDLMLHSQLAVPQYDAIKWSYYGQI